MKQKIPCLIRVLISLLLAIKAPMKKKLLIRKVNKMQSPLNINVFPYSVVVRNIYLLIVIQLYKTRKTVLFVGKLSTQLKHVGRISSVSNVVGVIIKQAALLIIGKPPLLVV